MDFFLFQITTQRDNVFYTPQQTKGNKMEAVVFEMSTGTHQ